MDEVPAHSSKKVKLLDGNCDGDKSSTHEQIKVPVTAASPLPEEILEKIFSNLDSAKDLHAVSNASDQFNRILEPSKPTWAFELIFPNLFPKLNQQDMLNCRLVCRKWCQAVDQDLESRPTIRVLSLYPDEHGSRPLYAPRFRTNLISKAFRDLILLTPRDIRSFMEEMGDHPRNPLILRSVYLHNFMAFRDFWDLTLNFLARFGNEIWHIGIASFQDNDMLEYRPFIECSYDLLEQILGLLPNLKTIGLCGTFGGRANGPLPPLPRLQTLDLLIDDNYERSSNQPFLREFIQSYSSQLKMVAHCSLSTWQTHRSHFSSLPQVREITLVIDAGRQTWINFCHKLVAPNLAKLNLFVAENVTISNLLRPLAGKFPSLSYLKLRFNCTPQDFRVLAPPPLVLNNVKTLEILDNDMAEYNQIFQHLPALEYLLVCHQQGQGNNVSFVDPLHWNLFNWIQGTSLDNSDIWTRLTSLKEMTLARLGDNGVNGDIEHEIRARKTFTRKFYASLQI